MRQRPGRREFSCMSKVFLLSRNINPCDRYEVRKKVSMQASEIQQPD